MSTSKKAEPGGSAASKPAMFVLEDEPLFRLFDLDERDVVVRAISDAHDLPHIGFQTEPGRRTSLAFKLRERLLTSVVAYMDRLQAAGAGFQAPEYHAAVSLMGEINRVAAALESSEGGELSGDAAVALGQTLRLEWTNFIGDASAHRVFLDIPAELAALQARKAQARVASKAPRPRAKNPLKKRIEDVMRPQKRDGAAFKTIMQRWEMEKTLDDLTIVAVNAGPDAGKYLIRDDRPSPGERQKAPNARAYEWDTLEKMFAQTK